MNLYSTAIRTEDGAIEKFVNDGNCVVYEYIDAIDSAISGDMVAKLEALRAEAVEHASFLTYSAKALAKDLLVGKRELDSIAYVPNGVDLSMYELSDDMVTPHSIQAIVDTGKPIVGYFGAIAPWIWLEAILEIAKQMPEAEILLIGPTYADVQLPEQSAIPSNLHFHPAVAAKDLVQFARHFTVGFIPFRNGEIAQTTSPLKLFEYFALGLPTVVTKAMVECTRFREVRPASSAYEFTQQLRAAIQDASDMKLRARILDLAKANSWEMRAETTLKALNKCEVLAAPAAKAAWSLWF
jgi:glycosyltransferase involved in cell wall biosynthesis